MSEVTQLPKRAEVDPADTWDLSSLFADDAGWEAAFRQWEGKLDALESYKGRLSESPAVLAEFIALDLQIDQMAESAYTYAMLKYSEDTSNGTYQGFQQRALSLYGKTSQLSSFFRPELLAMPQEQIDSFLQAPELADYKILLERILRYKPHTLNAGEERLLAMQTEMSVAARQIFEQLTNADMKFGNIELENGETIELSHASFSRCLHSPVREVRKKAFHQYYEPFTGYANTLAAALAGSVNKDVYFARARNFPSVLESSLFADNVPVSVYDNLVQSVRRHLPTLHRYYSIRQRALGLDDLHHYDTYVPLFSELKKTHTWDQAVNVVVDSLKPLGGDYLAVLEKGLRGRWCDRYENKGKRSGAFSSGAYTGDPYILMNYQQDVLDHVFTLTHEAGHSMHTYHSTKHQPYHYYQYTIFVAEVASTFNEQLLNHHLMSQASDDKERAYLVAREIDELRGTIFRQTMFAEFERLTHEIVERSEPLTLDRIKSEYKELLTTYFGPNFTLDDELQVEGLRIPHFYSPFYVYKYATGMSAAIALSQKVLKGDASDTEAYLNFLRGGCSKYPLDLLRDAGVDMESPEPVDLALEHFGRLVDELDQLVS